MNNGRAISDIVLDSELSAASPRNRNVTNQQKHLIGKLGKNKIVARKKCVDIP